MDMTLKFSADAAKIHRSRVLLHIVVDLDDGRKSHQINLE
jgi:hypothetical protein